MYELENFVDTNEDTLMREVQGKLYSYNHQQSIINTCTGLIFQLSVTRFAHLNAFIYYPKIYEYKSTFNEILISNFFLS